MKLQTLKYGFHIINGLVSCTLLNIFQWCDYPVTPPISHGSQNVFSLRLIRLCIFGVRARVFDRSIATDRCCGAFSTI